MISWIYNSWWFQWVLKLAAIYLSFRCNVNEYWILRIIYMIIAYYFYQIYLVYYFGYHYLLSQPCANSFGGMGVIYR